MIVLVNFFTLHWQKFHSLSVDIITACPKALNSKAITDVLLSVDHFTVSDAILFGEGEGFGEGAQTNTVKITVNVWVKQQI